MTTKNTTTAETRTAAVNNTPAALKQTKAHFVLNEYPGLSEALLRALGGSSEEKTAARNA